MSKLYVVARLSMLLALAASVLACTPGESTANSAEPLEKTFPSKRSERVDAEGLVAPKAEAPSAAPEALEQEELVELSEAEAKSYAQASNEFAFELFSRLDQTASRFALGTSSITTALMMTYAGAVKETEREFVNVLHLPFERAKNLSAAGSLVRRTQSSGKKQHLESSQALFVEQEYRLRRSFVLAQQKHFGAEVEATSFLLDPSGARNAINDWVDRKTQHRISELLPPGSIRPKTRLVLVNATHFLGKWQKAFSEKKTQPLIFHEDKKSYYRVQTMRARDEFRAAFLGEASLLDLPYAGGQLSMTLVLPAKRYGLDQLLRSLDSKKFDEWLGQIKPHKNLVVRIPRFEIEPSRPMSLQSQLRELGLERATDERARFDLISAPGQDPFHISDVLHQTYVKVSEAGTEAAAATAVLVAVPVSFRPGARQAPSFSADQPFLFFIRERATNHVLFMGRINELPRD